MSNYRLREQRLSSEIRFLLKKYGWLNDRIKKLNKAIEINTYIKIIGDLSWCKGFIETSNMPNVAAKLQENIDKLLEEIKDD